MTTPLAFAFAFASSLPSATAFASRRRWVVDDILGGIVGVLEALRPNFGPIVYAGVVCSLHIVVDVFIFVIFFVASIFLFGCCDCCCSGGDGRQREFAAVASLYPWVEAAGDVVERAPHGVHRSGSFTHLSSVEVNLIERLVHMHLKLLHVAMITCYFFCVYLICHLLFLVWLLFFLTVFMFQTNRVTFPTRWAPQLIWHPFWWVSKSAI